MIFASNAKAVLCFKQVVHRHFAAHDAVMCTACHAKGGDKGNF